MILNHYIQKQIYDKMGLTLNLPSQFEQLSESIFKVTGKTLGVNTLKRLFGKLPDVHTSETTLNIVAEYLGFSDWESLKKISEEGNSKIVQTNMTVYPKDMSEGKSFTLTYAPHRELQLMVKEDKRCLVTSSKGGKLHKGDILDIAEITVGYPFNVQRVERNGASIGAYKGGLEGGVEKIEPKK